MSSLFSPLTSSHLGFDTFFSEIDQLLDLAANQTIHGGFPPMNIFRNDGDYTIEMAIAGFKEGDIKIEHNERTGSLTVFGETGASASSAVNSRQVVRQGIAARKFSRRFLVADNLKVESATLEHGMLTIKLVADEEKTYTPKIIPLSAAQPVLPAPEKAEEGFLSKITSRKKESQPV